MMTIYNKTSYRISKVVTQSYSTSFSFATSLLNKEHREAIYAIYGFVRLADEIVDTFHDWDKEKLLVKFELDLKEALEQKISLNPVLNSFQLAVYKYNISYHYIDAFLKSMKADLKTKDYLTRKDANDYIYGSADVVGLMCLRVFCDGDDLAFDKLSESAKKLGSAFQKVNFLRDLKNDIEELNRHYFPEIGKSNFDDETKLAVIQDIKSDFKEAFVGLKKLPPDSKAAVYVAYLYYKGLLKKLERSSAKAIRQKRIRISNTKKMAIMIQALIRVKTKQI